eukprot:CAMPEP_0202726072 /NCGR_PEP_ID=MMETSP1385-20130828/184424_1 /ASSEMBLY_ACC=CAM_ASM_000861 /TAXON_ID=933848 /ORGANISM="Elphidium margaritaceum" /LENGTH=852 /DNA_ID=CAMNT_0049392285 /DNA_START=180 /DNA_END=2739 /DNA_ORIENTATION=-
MSISECQIIEDLVLKKLAKNKPYIKYKALRIVKYLCEEGSPNWRRAWQRSTDKLRDAQQYRGTPDPIYGDAPYQSVRTIAKEAMQAIFQQHHVDASHIRRKIQSIEGGSSAQFSSGSKGVFSNSSFNKKDDAPSAASAWNRKVMPGRGNTDYIPSVKAATFEPLKSPGTYSNPSVLAQKSAHSRGKLDNRSAGKRSKGKAGGVWGGGGGDDDDNEEEDEEDTPTDYRQSLDDEVGVSAATYYERPKQRKAFGGNIKKAKPSSGQYEKKWVDDIVKSGGIGCKIVDVDKYVSQFENLSKNHVLEYLDEKLEDATWQKQGKALTLIDALMAGKSSEHVLEYFTQSPDNIQALTNHKKSLLRKKANAILENLDVDEEEEEEDEEYEEEQAHQAMPQRQQPQILAQQSADLLGVETNDVGAHEAEEEEHNDMFADMEEHDVTGVASGASADLLGVETNDVGAHEAEEEEHNDMFADMEEHDVTGVASGGVDLFGAMQQTENRATVNAANNNKEDDIMGILGNVEETQRVAQIVEKQQRQKANYAYLDVLANEAHVSQNDVSGDIMSMAMGAAQNTQQQQQQQASTTQSAFGFQLDGNNAAAAAAAAGNISQPQQQPQMTASQQPPQQQQQQSNMGASAFGFDLGASVAAQSSAPPQQNTQASGGGGGAAASAFGFDLGANAAAPSNANANVNVTPNLMPMGNNMNQMGNNMGNNMNAMMNPMSQMNQMNQMMRTQQMMAANQTNMSQMNAMMNQMNQMRVNMGQMPMPMGNMAGMMQPNNMMNQMGGGGQGNSFLQAMQGVNNPAQQTAAQNYAAINSDPFAQVMASGNQTTQMNVAPPKQTGPDQFAEFSLRSMR